MQSHELKHVIEAADKAITAEDFDTLMTFYADNATLVVKPGLTATGKEQIRNAFVAIAEHFNHSLVVKQGRMLVIEGDDTALVIMETLLSGKERDGSAFSMARNGTYVFKRGTAGQWLCAIDNSYGSDLLKAEQN